MDNIEEKLQAQVQQQKELEARIGTGSAIPGQPTKAERRERKQLLQWCEDAEETLLRNLTELRELRRWITDIGNYDAEKVLKLLNVVSRR